MIRRAAAALAALALPGLAHAGDTIQFDPRAATAAQYVEAYEGATDQCMHGRASALLYGGERSKAEIVSQLATLCGPTLRKIYIERAGMSEKQADAAVRRLATHALRNTMLELGAAE